MNDDKEYVIDVDTSFLCSLHPQDKFNIFNISKRDSDKDEEEQKDPGGEVTMVIVEKIHIPWALPGGRERGVEMDACP